MCWCAGVLSAIAPVSSILFGPAAAAVSDLYSLHRTVMVGSTLFGAVLLPALLIPGLTFAHVFMLLSFTSLVGGKATSILDAGTMDAVGAEWTYPRPYP
jgi:hypothetical protein|eukprot:COSAG01_NODE_1991_length_8696_cov_971.862743_7_plen_99_part_00